MKPWYSVAMEPEEWRVIEGFEEYAVSSLGRIKRIVDGFNPPGRRTSKAGKILKPWPTKGGYPELFLVGPSGRKRVRIHQAVCRAFHGPQPTPVHEVAHWDGYPPNVAASNLRWATKSENAKDMNRHGTNAIFGHRPKGETHHSAKLSKAQVLEIAERYGGGERPTGLHWGIKKIAKNTASVKVRFVGFCKGAPGRLNWASPVATQSVYYATIR